MCIRDRVGGEAGRKRRVGELEVGEVAVEAVAAVEASGEACLLYTSDAADERSSVDLGGRRIIKKKKNNITQTNSRIF